MEDFSLIILCRGRRHLLSLTLDTLKAQTGAFEVILLDGEGSGRLPEFVPLYPELKIKVQDASGRSLARMMNQGIQLASGHYVQFLEPGDRYLSPHGLTFLKELIGHKPPLITARGVSPEAQSHWFLREKVLELGGLDERLFFRPLLDLLFRFQKRKSEPLFCRRAIVDAAAEEGGSFAETCRILYRHFGLWRSLKWLFSQNRSQNLARKLASFFKQAFWKSNL